MHKMLETTIKRYEVYSGLQDRALCLHEKLFDNKLDGIPGFENWTGLSHPIGAGDGSIYYNTYHSAVQLIFTLALSKHPLVDKILKSEISSEELVKAKVLSMLKILELGCGRVPTYARCCRAMGAKFYTLDKDPELEFYLGKEEQRKNICLDFMEKDSVQKILKITGGNFDLVTSSFLPCEAKELVPELLKAGGIYYDSEHPPESRSFYAYRKI